MLAPPTIWTAADGLTLHRMVPNDIFGARTSIISRLTQQIDGALGPRFLKMGNNLLGDGLDVPGTVLTWARYAENEVPRPGVDILL